MSKFFWVVLTLNFLLFFLAIDGVWANSTYVLPYPSFMPGHKLYQAEQVLENLRHFWAFGNFSRHKHELGLADKKLVEAKVLFEYRQYFLALKALSASDRHFQEAKDYLSRAKGEGKDISQKEANLKAAAEKHKEILEALKEVLPEQFLWQPEKGTAEGLNLKLAIEEAIKIREV